MAWWNTAVYLDTTAGLAAGTRSAGDIMLPEKALLKSAGWAVLSSGTNPTYDATGDALTTAALCEVARAWFRIQRPDGGAEFVIQFIANATTQPTYRIKYALAGFTGGAPNATTVPSAADEVVLIGGGTDAAPTGQIWMGDLGPGDNPRRLFGAADSAPPYGFWFGLRAQAANNSFDHGWLYDPMQPWVARPAGNDPYAHYVHIGTGQTAFENGGWSSYASAQNGPFAWINKSLDNAAASSGFARMFVGPADWGVMNITDPEVFGVAGAAARRDLEPAFYGRSGNQANPRGFKGVGSVAACVMANESIASVVYSVNGVPDAYFKIGRTGLNVGGVGLLWGNGTPSGYSQREAVLWQAMDNNLWGNYRMRGIDGGQIVRWWAPFNDATGTLYTGPGPLTDIVVDNIIGEFNG